MKGHAHADVKAHSYRSAFYLILAVTVCLIPLAIAQRANADSTSGTSTNTGSLNTARRDYTATLLPNGIVLVAGGFNGTVVGTAELYDPGAGTWTTTGSLNTPRYRHTATLLPNGKVIVAGGVDSSGLASASAELYDPTSG